MKRAILVAALTAGALLSFDVVCPIDGHSAHKTGQVTSISGHLVHEYRCGLGHVFWFRE